MAISDYNKQLTLGQIQDILGTPQHVLIHLCEKGVIVPDFSDTEGRGRSRLFSQRNLLEFAIALHIRKFQIPVVVTKAIIEVIRNFENKVRKEMRGFSLKDLSHHEQLQLIIYIEEAEHLIFSLQGKDKFSLLKCSMSSLEQRRETYFVSLSELPSDYISRLEINISKIIASLKNIP